MSSSYLVPILNSYAGKVQTVEGAALPEASIAVLSGTLVGNEAVDVSTQPGTPLATIYTDPYGQYPIEGGVVLPDDQGNFEFWAAPGWYVLQIYGSGIYQVLDGNIETQFLQGISIGSAAGGSFGQLQANNQGALAGIPGSSVDPATGAITLTTDESDDSPLTIAPSDGNPDEFIRFLVGQDDPAIQLQSRDGGFIAIYATEDAPLISLQTSGGLTATLSPTLGCLLPSFTVAGLPGTGANNDGAICYASNGRKVGEDPGAGTGVVVYCSSGAWRVFSTDDAVEA